MSAVRAPLPRPASRDGRGLALPANRAAAPLSPREALDQMYAFWAPVWAEL